MVREYSYPALVSCGYEEGRLWVANFVGLHGCWVEGGDREEVVLRAPSVLREYLKSCMAAGINLPDAPDASELSELDAGEVIIVSASLEDKDEDS